MKKYKVNGKIVIADSLRDAIVKYRKFNDEQTFSVNQKYHDQKGRIWEIKSIDGDLLTIAVNGKEMSNKLHKEIFAEWAKTWDVEDAKDAKKYYLRVKHQLGYYIFNEESDDPIALLRKYKKEAYSSSGNMFADFYSGTRETNLPTYDINYYRNHRFDSADSVEDDFERDYVVWWTENGKDYNKHFTNSEEARKFARELRRNKMKKIGGAEKIIENGRVTSSREIVGLFVK